MFRRTFRCANLQGYEDLIYFPSLYASPRLDLGFPLFASVENFDLLCRETLQTCLPCPPPFAGLLFMASARSPVTWATVVRACPESRGLLCFLPTPSKILSPVSVSRFLHLFSTELDLWQRVD